MNALSHIDGEPGRLPVVKLFVCSLVDSEWQALNIVDRFRGSGFRIGDISLLFSSRSRMAPLESEAGFAIGVLDTVIGGFSALQIPLLGMFLGAGPILRAFAEHDRAVPDDLSSPLRAFGISQNRARYYAQGLTGGEILIAVHSAELNQAKYAEQILCRSGAKDVGYSGSLVVLCDPEEDLQMPNPEFRIPNIPNCVQS
jgi:hypothetical protein